jgi:hypothetical protein
MTLLDPKTEALAWRAEIDAELAEAKKKIPALQSAYEATGAAVSEAAINHRKMLELLLERFETQSGTRYESPEPDIHLRLENLRMKLDEAKQIRAQALADLESARDTVARKQRSLNQVDRRIPPAEEAEEAAA